MSDIDPTSTTEPEAPPADSLAELRAAAERGKTADAEAAAARRELAFLKAGIDTDTGVGKLLFENYKGDPTKDAVLAAASEYGIAPKATDEQPPPAAEPPTYNDDERSQTRERANLATGSEVPAGEPNADPIAEGYSEYLAARATGVPQNDAADHVIGRIMKAAYADGDPRVLHDQNRWLEDARGSSRPSR